MHTATIPMWQSECSPPHKRGMLVMVEGLLITGGICMAYWIDVRRSGRVKTKILSKTLY